MIKLKICNKRYWDKDLRQIKKCPAEILDSCDLCQIRKEQSVYDNRYYPSKYNSDVVLDLDL